MHRSIDYYLRTPSPNMNDDLRYPRFTKKLYENWFKHWLVKRFQCCCQTCLECKAIEKVLVFGTRLLLDGLFADQKRFLNGSNVVGIAIGSMTRKQARAILKTQPQLTNVRDVERRRRMLERKCDSDFPNLQVHTLESYSPNVVSLYRENDDNLYAVLSYLY